MKKIHAKAVTALLVAFAVAASFVGTTAAAAGQPFSGMVNINTASLAELMQLSGIGEAKAKAIIARRTSSPFKQTAELKEIKGIGEKLFAKLRDHVAVTGPSLVNGKAAAPVPGAAATQGQ